MIQVRLCYYFPAMKSKPKNLYEALEIIAEEFMVYLTENRGYCLYRGICFLEDGYVYGLVNGELENISQLLGWPQLPRLGSDEAKGEQITRYFKTSKGPVKCFCMVVGNSVFARMYTPYPPPLGYLKVNPLVLEPIREIARTRDPYVLTYIGPTSHGKTTLLKSAAEDLAASGYRVLWIAEVPKYEILDSVCEVSFSQAMSALSEEYDVIFLNGTYLNTVNYVARLARKAPLVYVTGFPKPEYFPLGVGYTVPIEQINWWNNNLKKIVYLNLERSDEEQYFFAGRLFDMTSSTMRRLGTLKFVADFSSLIAENVEIIYPEEWNTS